MKKILLAISFILTGLCAHCQWKQLNVTAFGNNIYALRQYDHNFIYGGGQYTVVTSTDGGATFSQFNIVDTKGRQIVGSIISSMQFISPTTGFAVGTFNLTDTLYVLKTVNGGKNWSFAEQVKTGALPYTTGICFVNSLEGFVSTNDGSVFKTLDGGNNWSIFHLTNDIIENIYFRDAMNGFALSDYYIYKTTDGGSSWDSVAVPVSNFVISFPTASVGYVAGFGILKTTDGGSSWQEVNTLNLPEFVTAITFISPDTGFVTSGRTLYRTTDGALTWQKVVMPRVLNDVAFYGPDSGYIAGDTGLAMSTIKGGQPWAPVVNFKPAAKTFCVGSPIQMINLSNNAPINYTWRVNGLDVASGYNYSFTPVNYGNVTITLVGASSGGRDSVTQTFSISSPTIPPVAYLANDTVEGCIGSEVYVQVENINNAYSYWLRADTTKIASTNATVYGYLDFYVPPVDSNPQYNLYVTDSGACGIASQTINITTIKENPLDIVPHLSRDTVCYGDTATIYFTNTQPGITYNLKIGDYSIIQSKTSNGGLLSFVVTLDSSTTFNILADYKGCITQFSEKIRIGVNLPQAYFALNNFNPQVGEPLRVVNNSISLHGSYNWNFGSSAVPQTSIDSLPGSLVFSKTGQYKISLKIVSAMGCDTSLTHVVNVVKPYTTMDSCGYSMIIGNDYQKQIGQLNYDNSGGYGMITGEYCDGCDGYVQVVNSRGDNARLDYFQGLNGVPQLTDFVKFSKWGLPKWSIYLSFSPSFCFDSSGNTYILMQGGSFITPDNYFYNMDTSSHQFLCKFDTMGILLWMDRLSFTSGGGYSKIKMDNGGNFYIYGGESFAKVSPAGQTLWSVNRTNIDLALGPNQDIWVLGRQYFDLSHYSSSSGQFIDSITPVTTFTYRIFADKLAVDGSGNIYVTANFDGSFLWKQDTIKNIMPPFNYIVYENEVLAKFDKSGKQDWLLQFKSRHNETVGGFIVSDSLVALTLNPYYNSYDGENLNGIDTITTKVLPDITTRNFGCLFYKCDTAGKRPELIKIYDPGTMPISDYPGGYGQTSSLDLLNNRILLSVSYLNKFTLMGDAINARGTDVIYPESDIAVFNGHYSCLDPNGPPQSDFNFASGCQGKNTFKDSSNNYTSQWSWSFPGGNPSSSASSNPTISYSDSGKYEVTLVAGNSYGSGDTIKRQIMIHALPNVTLALSVDTVCEAGAKVLLTGFPPGGTYSGIGVTGDMFDPTVYGTGNIFNGIYHPSYTYTSSEGCTNTASQLIVVEECTGIQTISPGTYIINLFPNPVAGTLYLYPEMRKTTMRVFDAVGKLCLSDNAFAGNELNVSLLPAGLYHLTLISIDGKEYAASFVKVDE